MSDSTPSYQALFGSPTEINISLQTKQGLILHSAEGQRDILLSCHRCVGPKRDRPCWTFCAYPLGGSLSDVAAKARNTKVAREIKEHLRKVHANDEDVPAAVPRQGHRGPGIKVAATAAVAAVPVHKVKDLVAEEKSIKPSSAAAAAVPCASAVPTVHPDAMNHGGNDIEVQHALAGGKIQLPCMIEQKFRHPLYGMMRVQAVLLWADVTLPEPVEAQANVELFHSAGDDIPLVQPDPGHDETLFPGCSGFNWPTRMCFFHQIRAVEPRESPLANYVGQMFSSFIASTRQFGSGGTGFGGWHLLNQPKWSMARAISERGFFNIHLETSAHAFGLQAMQLVRTDQQQRREGAYKNMLMTGSLALIAKKDLEERLQFATETTTSDPEIDGSNSPDSDRTRPVIYSQQVDAQGEWLRMVPTWMVAGVTVSSGAGIAAPKFFPDQYVTQHRRLARLIRDCQLGDISFRDALAMSCKLECSEMDCDQHEEAQNKGLFGYQCKHGVFHHVLARDLKKADNVMLDPVHGYVDTDSSSESDAAAGDFANGDDRQLKGRKRRGHSSCGPEDGGGKRKKRCTLKKSTNFKGFVRQKASPFESCIRLQRYNYVKFNCPQNHALVEKAVNLAIWAISYYFNYFPNGDSRLKPKLQSLVTPAAFTALVNEAERNTRLWESQRCIRDMGELAAWERYWQVDRSGGRFSYWPEPEWFNVGFVLRNKANREFTMGEDSVSVRVAKEVYHRLFPTDYK